MHQGGDEDREDGGDVQAGTLRPLGAADIAAYRRPFPTPGSCLPTLAFAREIPVGGEPVDVHDLILGNQQVLRYPERPIQLLHATPGAVIGPGEVQWCRDHGRLVDIEHLGAGAHLLPADLPPQIAGAVIGWGR